MKIKSFWREKYALILLKRSEAKSNGSKTQVQESNVAMVGAYLFPT